LFDSIQADSDNPMSLANVRDAALRSRFSSREALDAWLGRAIGGHARYLDLALQHVHRALALSPLQGRGYVYLAELGFLENAGEGWKAACLEQALRVRPFDGEVLYAGATEALLAGDYDRWLELARRSFQSGRRHQRRLIADLIGRTPPEALEDMIQVVVREFHPDLAALRELCARARGRGRPEQLVWLERRCAEQAESDAKLARGEDAARLWNEARQFHASIGDAARASECARSAVAADPSSFAARYGLGLTLLEQGHPDEAETHLRWCLQRRPNDSEVEAKWKEALKGRLDREHETATRKDDHRRT
jgi:tetratricopeptide (TPR) repeat protein